MLGVVAVEGVLVVDNDGVLVGAGVLVGVEAGVGVVVAMAAPPHVSSVSQLTLTWTGFDVVALPGPPGMYWNDVLPTSFGGAGPAP